MGRAYGAGFWTAYLANILVSAAWALLFRYADFVTHLGGSELHLGWIVGVGMVGSVVMRFFLGSGIDRHGPRVIWLVSLAVLAVALFAHLAITDYQGPAIYGLRMLRTAVAGVVGASATSAPPEPPWSGLAELIGRLGNFGLLGCCGGSVGDLPLRYPRPGTLADRTRCCVVAGLLTVLALPVAWWAAPP